MRRTMGPKRQLFRCGWRTIWVLAMCMVVIGRVGVKDGNAPPDHAALRLFGIADKPGLDVLVRYWVT